MSKRQSSTSNGLLDRAVPVVVLDENLSSPDIVEELRRWNEDWKIELHRTHFPDPKTPDPKVLEVCGQNGWILVSADDRMRRVPINVEAAKRHDARVFLFPRTYTSGAEYRAALTAGRHRLLKFAKKIPPPNFARITKEGSVGFFAKDAEARSTARGRTVAKYGEVFDKTEAR